MSAATTKKTKIALITGTTGQDGAYLSRLLLGKGYTVHGTKRRSSMFNTQRVDSLYQDPHVNNGRFVLHNADMTDSTAIIRLVQEIQPDEIYNLGAQSHVKVSFESPEYTADTVAIGVLRVLEAIRILNMEDRVRLYQASTSEMYGGQSSEPLNEESPFEPRSPYASAKVYAHHTVCNYREAYGIFGANGILFNHESPVRGETFVTRKITRAVADRALGQDECLYLGNLNARRDWGHASDYVDGMWRILQHDRPEDFVLATGRSESVRRAVELAFACIGIQLQWEGEGEQETGVDKTSGKVLVQVDPRYFRPLEVDTLLGDPSKAKRLLGWQAKVTLEQMIEEMVSEDIRRARDPGQPYML